MGRRRSRKTKGEKESEREYRGRQQEEESLEMRRAMGGRTTCARGERQASSHSRERKDAEEGDREYERFTAGSVLHK